MHLMDVPQYYIFGPISLLFRVSFPSVTSDRMPVIMQLVVPSRCVFRIGAILNTYQSSFCVMVLFITISPT